MHALLQKLSALDGAISVVAVHEFFSYTVLYFACS